jgi:hypothetical protein
MIGPGIVVAQTWDKDYDDFPNAEANEAFLAHARQDIPALIAEIRHLRSSQGSASPAVDLEVLALEAHAAALVENVHYFLRMHGMAPTLPDEVRTLDLVQGSVKYLRDALGHAEKTLAARRLRERGTR